MKKIILTVAVLTSLASCMPKEKSIKIDDFSQKLTVNSQVIPGDIMLVALTRSFSLLDNRYSKSADSTKISEDLMKELLVEDALVTISYQDKVDTLVMLSPGLYAGIQIPQNANELYTLNVNDNKKNMHVVAQSTMLEKVELKTVNCYMKGDTLKVDYTFDDPAQRNNYMLNVYYNPNGSGIGSANPSNWDVSNFLTQGNTYASYATLSDQNFESSSVHGTMNIPDFDDANISDTLIVSLSNISEDYYNYLSLRTKAGKNVLTQVFGEPINYPSNVQGGLGFFLTHSPDPKLFIMNK